MHASVPCKNAQILYILFYILHVLQTRFPISPLLPRTCSDIVYVEIRGSDKHLLKLVFSYSTHSCWFKNLKRSLNKYRIIDNVFNNNINYHYVQKKMKYNHSVVIGHILTQFRLKLKEKLTWLVEHEINSVPVELLA